MTARELIRIRKRLADSARLTREAYELAVAGHADDSLRSLCARATDDARDATVRLAAWDERNRLTAEAIARELR